MMDGQEMEPSFTVGGFSNSHSHSENQHRAVVLDLLVITPLGVANQALCISDIYFTIYNHYKIRVVGGSL